MSILAAGLADSVLQLLTALVQFALALFAAALPWAPLLLWVVFWLLAVNWRKLTPILVDQGGWIGVLLIALVAILVWSSVSIPPDGMHHFLGLHVSNWVGKGIYVTALIVIAGLCGTVQNSGLVNCCVNLDDPPPAEPAPSHDAHGHH